MVDYAAHPRDKSRRSSSITLRAVQQSHLHPDLTRLPPAAELLRRRLRQAGASLWQELDRERRQWILWLPVALGTGVALFFALPGAPGPAFGWTAVALALALATLARRRPLAPVTPGEALLLALAAVLAGLVLAQLRLAEVAAPVLERPGVHGVEGRVLDLAPMPGGAKLLLGEVRLERVPPERTPRQVRVNLRGAVADLAPGDRVRLRARLQAPMPPALPGGFDYARQAYFEGLGALGFAIGRPERLPADRPMARGIANLRAAIAARIHEVAPGAAGAMSAALIAGVRAGIDQDTWRDMQVSGLAHLISVSGLHMVMVAGSVFLAVRWLLALIPALALRYPVKRIAALVALMAAAFYLVLSGNSVPTQRSFLMTAAGLVGVIFDRNPLSLRLLAWSALVVLLVRPEAVFGASFQLSFAAVLALIVIYEAWSRKHAAEPDQPKASSAPWRYFAGVCATTLIANTATTPFAAFHFQTIPTYGVAANLVAVPLTSFIVMPAGMIGLLLMPLGWDGPAFALMVFGVEGVLAVAHAVAMLPGAVLLVAQWPGAGLTLLAAGGLWLALWRRPWRWLGLVPAAATLGLILLARPPDLLVAGDLGMAALREGDGSVTLLEWDRDGLIRETWLRNLGAAEARPAPRPGAGPAGGMACDPFGCLVTVAGRKVALSRRAEAVSEDCGRADLVLARAGPEGCSGGGPPGFGPLALARSGGLAVWAGRDGLEVRSVAESRGRWPWTEGPR